MKTFHRQSLPRTLTSLAAAVLLLLYGFPALAVTITAPKQDSKVKGTIHVSATPGQGEEGFAYAILLVDSERQSVSNVQPLRFDLNTADLSNGPHLLQIQLSDLAGLLAKSKTVRIIVANPVPGSVVTAPAPAVKPVSPPAPKPAKPATKPSKPVAAPPAQDAPTAIIVPVIPAAPAAAPRPVRGAELTVVMDGKPLMLSVKPIIQRGRAMVLLRPLIEAMGGQLGWDAEKKQVVASVEGRQYTFTIGENAVQVDGTSMPIDRPAMLLADRTVIPITIWRDIFGGTVEYNALYGSISLSSPRKLITPGPAIATR
ncbi:MAG: copper amine oxidase N-terminal domain-containing protein [Armatimonadota bacterium]